MNSSIKPYMTTWDIVRCADYHFRRVIYGLGPYIADYPEQSTAAGTVYGWCVTFVLYNPLSSDLLMHVFRCDADPTNLDGSPAELRTLAQYLMLLDSEDEDTLWFGHGIVPGFLVRPTPAPMIR
jgi:hypothetical protein